MSPILLSSRLRARYLATTWEEVVDRIVNGTIVKHHPLFPASLTEQNNLRELLLTQTFVPAGNTLAFGAASPFQTASSLQPNCSVFDYVTEDKATTLWDKGIGVGTTLPPNMNPVPHIKDLQRRWNELKAQHRPLRGNMFVYPASGKFIREFIALKATPADADAIPGFNISVAVNGCEPPPPDDVLDLLAHAAWNTGDPGVVFMDRVNQNVPLRHMTRNIKTLVPCGEQGMFDGEFCTLGSINLNSPELANPSSGKLCIARLEHAIRHAVTFLDNAVDVCDETQSTQYRRIGLGVMGWADYLARHDVPYESYEARSLATQVSCTFGAIARHQSMELAASRGPFPRYLTESLTPNISLLDQDALMRYPRPLSFLRNVSVSCLAPTGGISLLTKNRGFAIEPFFHRSTTISAQDHIRMAAAWQTGICNSVSKTVNLPETATVDDVKQAILFAYKTRQLKALSVYRTNSRAAQPIQT